MSRHFAEKEGQKRGRTAEQKRILRATWLNRRDKAPKHTNASRNNGKKLDVINVAALVTKAGKAEQNVMTESAGY